MRKLIIVVSFLLLSSTAHATPIQNLPGLTSISVCFAHSSPGSHICGGPNINQLIAGPDNLIQSGIVGVGKGEMFTALTDATGDTGKGDEYFLLYLEKGNSTYWLDSVSLVFGLTHEYAINIATAALEFAHGNSITDLSKALGKIDNNIVGINSGSIVFSFASSTPPPIPDPIPEPSTIILLGIGLVGIASVSLRKRFKKAE